MKAKICLSFFGLFIAAFSLSRAQGIHWSYQTRVTQHYDTAPGEKAFAAPAPEFVPYPIYPLEMLRAGIEGAATLGFRVTGSGSVEDIRLVKATHKEFSAATLKTVETWRFLPLSKNGPNYPSSVLVVCSFKFEIPQEP